MSNHKSMVCSCGFKQFQMRGKHHSNRCPKCGLKLYRPRYPKGVSGWFQKYLDRNRNEKAEGLLSRMFGGRW